MDELEKQTASPISAEQLSTTPKIDLGPVPEAVPEVETASKIKPKIRLKAEKSTATKVVDDPRIGFLSKRVDELEKEVFFLKNKTEDDFKDIDQNLEQNFTNIYQQISEINQSLPEEEGEAVLRKPIAKRTKFSRNVTPKVSSGNVKPKVSSGKKNKKDESYKERFTKWFFGEKIGGALINAVKGKKSEV